MINKLNSLYIFLKRSGFLKEAGILSDLKEKYEEYSEDIQGAFDSGVKPNHIQWIVKIKEGIEAHSFEDLIVLVLSFYKAQQNLEKKDLLQYSSATEVIQAIQDYEAKKRESDERRRGISEQQREKSRVLKEKELINKTTDIIYESDKYLVVLPGSTQSSIMYGNNTSWCTAYTSSNNMFNTYAIKQGILLYYIITKGIEPREDSMAKISIGILNRGEGDIKVLERESHATVDAVNTPLAESEIISYLEEDGNTIINKIKEDAKTREKTSARRIIENSTLEEFKHNIEIATNDQKKVLKREFATYSNNEEILEFLLQDKDEDPWIKEQIAENTSSLRLLSLLARDESSWIREVVFQNKNMPTEALLFGAKDKRVVGDKNIGYYIAKHPNVNAEILTLLSKIPIRLIRIAVADNPKTPKEMLLAYSKDKDGDVRANVSGNPNAPAEALLILSQDPYIWTRTQVAENPSAPAEVLSALAKDKIDHIRAAVAHNPNITLEIALFLVKDSDEWVRESLAGNSYAPKEALLILSKDNAKEVVRAVKENPNMSEEVLDAIINTHPESYKELATSSKPEHTAILPTLAKSNDVSLRYCAAANPNTPIDILNSLINDKNKLIKEMARKRMRERFSFIQSKKDI